MLSNQPLSIGGILDGGFTLFRQGFAKILPAAAIAALPYSLTMSFLNARTAGLETETDPAIIEQTLLEFAVLFPLMFLSLVLMVGIILHRQVAVARAEPISLLKDVLVALKRAVPMIVLMLLYMVLVMLGSVALLIPGIILTVSMSLFFYVPYFEERGSWGALWRSHALVWGGNWWRTASVLTLVSVILFAVSFVFYIGIGIVAAISVASGSSALTTTADFILNWVVLVLVMPMYSWMALVLYNDLVLRKEGADLDEQLAELQPGISSAG
ncbi:MAG: hypothetical protein AAGA68_15475 [Pseudomonadota bacterium]